MQARRFCGCLVVGGTYIRLFHYPYMCVDTKTSQGIITEMRCHGDFEFQFGRHKNVWVMENYGLSQVNLLYIEE